jgi:hypothetical protein
VGSKQGAVRAGGRAQWIGAYDTSLSGVRDGGLKIVPRVRCSAHKTTEREERETSPSTGVSWRPRLPFHFLFSPCQEGLLSLIKHWL